MIFFNNQNIFFMLFRKSMERVSPILFNITSCHVASRIAIFPAVDIPVFSCPTFALTLRWKSPKGFFLLYRLLAAMRSNHQSIENCTTSPMNCNHHNTSVATKTEKRFAIGLEISTVWTSSRPGTSALA